MSITNSQVEGSSFLSVGGGNYSQTASFSRGAVTPSGNQSALRMTSGGSGSSSAVNQIASDLLALNRSNGKTFSSSAASATGSGAASGFAFESSTGFSSGSASGSAGFSSAQSSSNSVVLSEIEQAILRSKVPIEISETENLTVNFKGKQESGIWANRQEVINWKGVIPITEYIINEDLNPEVITKRSEQQLVYIQELAIRYLRPPTPPAPGEILITQEVNTLTPPAPPLVIRQVAARAETPEPLVIREAPPTPPAAVGRKVITISGKRIPPPPRKVVIERLAPLPSKPQSVMVERWLPYSQVKRRVIFQRSNQADAVAVKPRNVIVQWEAPQVVIKKEFKYLGVIRANPVEYVQRYGATLKTSRDLPDFVLDIKTPEGIVLAADYKYNSVHELEGDVKALGFIDLNKEGLTEYQAYLSKLGINFVGAANVAAAAAAFQSGSSSFGASASTGAASLSGNFGASQLGAASVSVGGASSSNLASTNNLSSDIILQIFKSIDTDNSGSISIDEAALVLLRLNSRLGRSYGEDEAKAFFNVLDTSKTKLISFEQFSRAFDRLNI